MPYCLFIIHCYFMTLLHQCHHFLFRIRSRNPLLSRYCKPANNISAVKSILKRRKRNLYPLRLLPCITAISHRRGHTYHLKINSAYQYIITYRIFVSAKQYFLHPRPDNTYFPLLPHIILIQETTLHHPYFLYITYVRVHAANLEVACLQAPYRIIAASVTAHLYLRRHHSKLLHLLQHHHIRIIKVIIPPRFHSFIRFSSGLCPHKKTIRRTPPEIRHHPILQSVARTKHYHQHKYSPAYTKRCKKGAQLILLYRCEYFLPVI